jgi:hypothetical protein
MERDQIKVHRTYATEGHRVMFVQDVSGQKVTFCYVGDVERHECSLGRFAARANRELENQ